MLYAIAWQVGLAVLALLGPPMASKLLSQGTASQTATASTSVTAGPPTVSMSAAPGSIERGGSVTLKWASSNAASATITPGIGTVLTSGSRSVSPGSTTTYELTGRSDSGKTATATVTVIVAEPGTTGGASADLIIAAASVSNDTLWPGRSFDLRAIVHNQGGSRSASTSLRYFRSTDATISTSDTEVGTNEVTALPAAGTTMEAIGLEAPAVAGTHYYGTCVDPLPEESATGNNCSHAIGVTVSGKLAGQFELDISWVSLKGIAFANGKLFALNGSGRPGQVYAYHVSGQRDPASDFDLDSDNRWPEALAFANGRFYVVDSFDDKVYAYLASGQRDSASDFDLDSDNRRPESLTFANGRFYVVDSLGDKVYAYLASGQRDSASDFALGELRIPQGITLANGRFYVVDSFGDKVYAYLASGQRDSASDFELASSIRSPSGIAFADGRFFIVDGSTVSVYSAAAQHGVATDFDLASSIRLPSGIAFANGKFYVVDSSDDKVYAYLASGQRDPASDFDLDSDNRRPEALEFANGGFYVVDSSDDKLYAYLASGQRDPASDFDLDSDTTLPAGLAFANGRFYVVDRFDDKVYAYLESGQRDADSDFELDASNGDPSGIAFANGRLYVADKSDGMTYAYRASGQGDGTYDVALNSGSGRASGITFAASRLYAVDTSADKVHWVRPTPELAVESASVNDTNFESGASLSFSAILRNRGTSDSTGAMLRYYLSAGEDFGLGATLVGSEAVSNLVPFGGNHGVSTSIEISDGCFFCGVCADPLDNEVFLDNNCSAGLRIAVGTVPSFDLEVSRAVLHTSSVTTEGDPMTMTVDVTNRGPDTSKPAKLRIGGSLVDIPALAPNGTVSYERQRVGSARLGTSTYEACISHAACDVNADNDCRSRSVTYIIG